MIPISHVFVNFKNKLESCLPRTGKTEGKGVIVIYFPKMGTEMLPSEDHVTNLPIADACLRSLSPFSTSNSEVTFTAGGQHEKINAVTVKAHYLTTNNLLIVITLGFLIPISCILKVETFD